MASTYSPALRLELMATGDQSGTWGDTTNTNLGTLLEQAITGYLSVAQGDVANLTLTTTNGGSDQARNAVVRVTGALTATRNVVVQTANKLYTVVNATTGGFSIVVKTSGGTGISVPPGASIDCYSDGTNVVSGQNYWNGQIGGAIWLDAGATVGPVYDLFRDSTSPAVSDIMGQVVFNGRDSAGNKQEYASIQSAIVSPTSTTEAGTLDVYTVKAGTRTLMASFTSAGTAFTAAAAYSFDAATTISNSAAGALLTVTSTDAGAGTGPSFDLYRDSASPAANDTIGAVIFNGRDSAANKQEYAAIYTRIDDATSGSEDASLIFEVAKAGSIVNYLLLGGTAAGVATANAVGLPQGLLSLPSAAVFNWNAGNYTLTHSAGLLTASGGLTTGAGVTVGVDSFAQGRVYTDASLGLVVGGKTGSTTDLFVATPAGNGILQVPVGTNTTQFFGAISPNTNDNAALGTTSLSWSDAFFASGAVLNFNAGNYTITHSAGLLTVNGSFKSSSATGGVGYATGAGGAQTQATSKSTTVVLNTICGAITMNNASLNNNTTVSFTLTNSAIAATDVVVLNHISGGTAGVYVLNAQAGAGSASINVRNISGGALGEAIVLQFVVVKAVNA